MVPIHLFKQYAFQLRRHFGLQYARYQLPSRQSSRSSASLSPGSASLGAASCTELQVAQEDPVRVAGFSGAIRSVGGRRSTDA